jgi:DNA-directed RNA polymerase
MATTYKPSPFGVAQYPHVSVADTKYNEDGLFHVKLILERSKETEDFVAKKWQAALEAIVEAGGEEAKKAASFLEWVGGSIPRQGTKRQVMVLPYGGTREAFFKYTQGWMDGTETNSGGMKPAGFDYAKATKAEKDYRYAVLSAATTALWSIVGEMLPGPLGVMKWLQETAKAVADSNQPVFWTVPESGFVVRHFYGKQEMKRVRIKLDGTTHLLGVYETTKDLDVQKQLQGVAPNFIHSLDAAALVMTINRSRAAGVKHLTAIHDAYGAHAGQMDTVGAILRRAFVDLHQHDVLGNFRKACRAVAIDMLRSRGVPDNEVARVVDERLPPMPLKGNLDIEAVVDSAYFFS